MRERYIDRCHAPHVECAVFSRAALVSHERRDERQHCALQRKGRDLRRDFAAVKSLPVNILYSLSSCMQSGCFNGFGFEALQRCRPSAGLWRRGSEAEEEMRLTALCRAMPVPRYLFCLDGLVRHATGGTVWSSVQRVAGVELAHAGEAAGRTQAPKREGPVNSLAVQRVAGSASAARAQFVDRIQIQILGLVMAGNKHRADHAKQGPGQNLPYRMQEFALPVFCAAFQPPSLSWGGTYVGGGPGEGALAGATGSYSFAAIPRVFILR
jgi:hypothetical protein